MNDQHTPISKKMFLCQMAMALLSAGASLHGTIPHLEKQKAEHHITFGYQLIDLGLIDLEDTKLSRVHSSSTLAPMVNNKGWTAANDSNQGTVFMTSNFKYKPQVSNVPISILAMDSQGNLLVNLQREGNSHELMFWPWEDNKPSAQRIHVHSSQPSSDKLTFVALNDIGTVIANKTSSHGQLPVVWSAAQGWQPLGAAQGLHLHARAKSINKDGHVIGIMETKTDSYPFFWDDSYGLEAMRSYRNAFSAKGWIEFSDMVLTDDDTVYGTFWVRYHTPGDQAFKNNPYYAYKWSPATGAIMQLGFKDMRIADVNNNHQMVGSWQGKAALATSQGQPLVLKALMPPDQTEGWELIEATSINDKGQIAGYGKYRGETHIFFAEPAQ